MGGSGARSARLKLALDEVDAAAPETIIANTSEPASLRTYLGFDSRVYDCPFLGCGAWCGLIGTAGFGGVSDLVLTGALETFGSRRFRLIIANIR
jgi:hypothetical protein